MAVNVVKQCGSFPPTAHRTRHLMTLRLSTALIGATAAVFVGTSSLPHAAPSGPVLTAAAGLVRATPAASASPTRVTKALDALASLVRPLSHPDALRDAFQGYFAF